MRLISYEDDEQQAVELALARVQNRIRQRDATLDLTVHVVMPAGDGVFAIGRLGPAVALSYPAGVTETSTMREIEATIAHELGHLAHGDVTPAFRTWAQRRVAEQEADRFAAEHGYGPGFIASLERDRAVTVNCRCHPPIDERIAAVRSHIKRLRAEGRKTMKKLTIEDAIQMGPEKLAEVVVAEVERRIERLVEGGKPREEAQLEVLAFTCATVTSAEVALKFVNGDLYG